MLWQNCVELKNVFCRNLYICKNKNGDAKDSIGFCRVHILYIVQF